MDVSLENLIEKIKKEAIEEGQQASGEIVDNAKTEAASIVDNARAEADKIVRDATNQAADLEESAKQALQQAARDVELLLKERIGSLFDRVFKREVGAALSPEFLGDVVGKMVTGWAREGQVEVTVNAADREKLEALLFSSLKEDVKNSVTIRTSQTVSKGFRIELKGENVYYDFTDDSIADALKAFINPSLQAILGGNDG